MMGTLRWPGDGDDGARVIQHLGGGPANTLAVLFTFIVSHLALVTTAMTNQTQCAPCHLLIGAACVHDVDLSSFVVGVTHR